MKNLSGVALRVFIFFFVLFALPRLIERIFFPTYINGHIWPTLNYVLIQGLVATAFMTLLLVFVHIWLVRRISNSANTDYGVRQTLETDVPQPSSSLFQHIKDKLTLNHWKLVQQDENTGLLKFEIYRSWRVWNDIVTIQLLPKGTQKTTVIAESKPDGWLQLTDNGKNLRNIQVLKHVLSQ